MVEGVLAAASWLTSSRDFGFDVVELRGLELTGCATPKDTDDTDRCNELGVCRSALRRGASVVPGDRLLVGLDLSEVMRDEDLMTEDPGSRGVIDRRLCTSEELLSFWASCCAILC